MSESESSMLWGAAIGAFAVYLYHKNEMEKIQKGFELLSSSPFDRAHKTFSDDFFKA